MGKSSEQSLYKTYAKEAKARLKAGFWQNANIVENSKENLKERIYSKTYEDDESFYRKVADLLDSPEVIPDVISRLADPEMLASPDTEAREIYLIELRSKYLKMKNRYEEEKSKKQAN